jgi:hypothetical protein
MRGFKKWYEASVQMQIAFDVQGEIALPNICKGKSRAKKRLFFFKGKQSFCGFLVSGSLSSKVIDLIGKFSLQE